VLRVQTWLKQSGFSFSTTSVHENREVREHQVVLDISDPQSSVYCRLQINSTLLTSYYHLHFLPGRGPPFRSGRALPLKQAIVTRLFVKINLTKGQRFEDFIMPNLVLR